MEAYKTGFVISKDGTKIGYRQIGNGRGLIICHGGGRISQNYEKLAIALSDKFTVFIPDRRGRGLSGQEGGNYDIQKATEDLIAVIKATSADYIFAQFRSPQRCRGEIARYYFVTQMII